MKKSNENLFLLNVVFVVCIIVGNVVASKLVCLGFTMFGDSPAVISSAVVAYAGTFLCTDIIGEIWGKEESSRTVLRGFIAQLVALLLILFSQYMPAYDDGVQQAFDVLLGQSGWMVIGSMSSYICSQNIDVLIFHGIRKRCCANSRKRWIWNNVSTMTSQLVDTTLFISISFGIGFGWFFTDEARLVLPMILNMYAVKFILALLDTPLFYLFTRKDI